MQAFDYVRARSIDEAVLNLREPSTRCLAGGTNLLDLMKGDIETPVRIVDINRLPLNEIVPTADGGLRIGALVRNSDLANHRYVRERYPLLSRALLAGASPQLRNMATVGGNLLQRTRCYYFYDTAYAACNKRRPGSGCAAREGYNRIHAIFGASPQCVATNPSDMSVALLALDAFVDVRSARGSRRIPLTDFHRLPGSTPERDTNLDRDELIVGVILPPSRFGGRVDYLKVRDRASYAFALVSVATGLRVVDGRVADARVTLGGVAHKPWRAEAAERALIGRPLNNETIAVASDAAVVGAIPLRDNAFKVDLARRTVARSLRNAGAVA
ncbi:MAG: xanthine dehydrogenase family protein subunit M [Betaproteobacteria bacterium]|nr:MAG: xanthine dehydrogenase family protein subunit M [Betaproteobacteria bacterium]